ncbi:prophage tail fiber N-terminal domain-containing protein [Aeromonas veronii]|uniref:prophage tail fiber N-terminal domain-containing protein n=1 Tax=Aeromonas veronii TaxID=654 RepID=UPI00344A0602
MIKLYGTITDPAGKPVPGALIELRSLTTTSEVLMGSELTFKCDANGRYSFDLAAGTYDVYAQNDLCHDMDYMGTGVVTAQSIDGPLNSILIDSGINLTPPLIERAVQAMQQAESAAANASRAQVQTAETALSVDHASKLASDQAAIASREATKAEGKAGEAAQSAKIAAGAELRAQQWAEESVDVVVTGKQYSARHHAVKAGEFAAIAGVSASESATSATIAAGKAESTTQSAALAAAKANEATISAKMSSTSADAAGKACAAAANSETSAKRYSAKAEEAAQASESAKITALDHAKQVAQQAQQVTGDRKRVEGLAKKIDEHSVTVSSLAQEVITNTAAARQAKTEVQSMRDTTLTKAAQAIAAADTASDKASLAAQDQAAANLSAQHASLAERMAEAWAQNPEGSDINGRPGEFSALHWALQAQKWAQAITSQLVWAGPWNAAAGAPVAPANNQGIPFYRVSHPGVIADVSFGVGDYLHWDPATKAWFKIDGTDAVISVNGMTGAVVLSAADVGARPASWVPQWDEVTNKPVTMPPSEHTHSWSQLTDTPVFALRWPTLKEIGAAAQSHTHQWSQLVGVPTYATRWPSWSEVTNKPDLAAASHRHEWDQLDQVPVTASRWPAWGEVTDKPALAAASHRHDWGQLNNVPVTASRWPSYEEVTGKPDFASSTHRHSWSQLDQVPVMATRWPAWGEVTGKPELAAANHRHAWSQLDQVPVMATRWPAWGEVTGKPELAAVNHRHTWSQLDQVPVMATRWPAWGEVTGKPDTMPPSAHNHSWTDLTGVPTQATRWPSWAEVTDKPALAAANHTHSYMSDGGSYSTLYLSNWFRSTGSTGWYNQTYGGGVYMIDTTWVRIYNNKKFHVSNTDANAIDTAGGVYAAGNGNFADVYIRSDKRLKSEFSPIIGALDKLKRLTGWIYTKNGQREAGLIAQEVAEVQPESVYINEDGYLSLAGAGVIALVIEAIKELDEKLGALNGRTK